MDRLVELYKGMYLIRSVEGYVRKHYHENTIRTPFHCSYGSEHISVGICAALSREDQVFCTYRSHALYLAKTDDVEGFFGEMYGKESGCCKGIGGSMHLCNPGKGFMGSSAIVSSHIPLAVGAAYANKTQGNDNIVACFFGDGATNEGAFWESLNFACLHKLRILFVCEDNGLAVHGKRDDLQSYDLDMAVESFFLIPNHPGLLHAWEVNHVYDYAESLIEDMDGPEFIIWPYHRFLEHVGVNEDYDAGYRERPITKEWFEFDPILKARAILTEGGHDRYAIEKDIDARVDAAAKAAQCEL